MCRSKHLEGNEKNKRKEITYNFEEDGDLTILFREIDEAGPLTSDRIREIDVLLLKFILKHYYPVSTVLREKGFRQMVRSRHPLYTMPLVTEITNTFLPHMYETRVKELKTIVQEQAETICLSVDRWLGANNIPLVAITAHFRTPDYQLKSVLLRIHYNVYDSEELEDALMGTCVDWQILSKINGCATDDGDEIVEAVNSLGWNHIRCMAYRLYHMYKTSFEMCTIVEKAEKITEYFKGNEEAVKLLEEYQTKAGIKKPYKLVYFNKAIWITKYNMVEVFVFLREIIVDILAKLKHSSLPTITIEDLIQWEQIHTLLKPFREVIIKLKTDKYEPASNVIPIVNSIKRALQVAREQLVHFNLCKDMIEFLESELNDGFERIVSDPNLALCTVLDPRYKMSMFVDKSIADITKSNLVSEVEKLMNVDTNITDTLKIDEEPRPSHIEDGSKSDPLVIHSLAQKEVESYLLEQKLDVSNRSDNAIEWWQCNKLKFPHLAKLFKTRCNNVATSVTGRQLFTAPGLELTSRRDKLYESHALMIVFLNANLDHVSEVYLRLMPESYHAMLHNIDVLNSRH